ncbi:MAG: SDR family NAD(P)-dependent oxidoreductase [Bifidobacteriaceae bacterium]|jgi:NAD(P)-dependent dehydrogenase (short-subunit alcohol dehydrogenase family)|nr:SDR family NAD(P)-dependent oxidoreductase [Bifidobacteriaceae bacterium]
MDGRPVALVTGASSGIGEAAVRELLARGFTVYAAARRVARMEPLVAAGALALGVDVTDEAQVDAALRSVISATGRIDALVNNAGYGSYGAVEDVPLSDARRQFEVNVFAMARLMQLVAPHMRAAGHGRIVNVSSMGGRFALELGGWYHATKYAVEALSDAARQELAPFGVDVVIVEPGLIATEWAGIAANHLRQRSGAGAYGSVARAFAAGLERAASSGLESDPPVVGRAIARAVTARRPHVRYTPGRGAKACTVAARVLPARAIDAAVTRILAAVGGRLDRRGAAAAPGGHGEPMARGL